MRFNKGNKVEVLQEAEVPPGSWRPAEIVSGNGHNYYVRYEQCSTDAGTDIERVPRKAIRPSPPPMVVPVCWATGDILEVFRNGSWKVAEVARTVDGRYCLIRLLGSSLELQVHRSNLRLRQLWQDGEWVVIRKDSARRLGGSFRSQSKGGKFGSELPQSYQLMRCSGDSCLRPKNHNVFEGDMSRGMKRKSSVVSPYATQGSEVTKRLRVLHRDEECQPLFAGHSPHLMEKVDAVDSPCSMLGEKYVHASLNKRTNHFPKMDSEGVNAYVDYQNHAVTIPDPSDTESTSSSVGSCSPGNSPYRSPYYPLAGQNQGTCSNSDDAECSSVSGRVTSLPAKDVLKEKTHSLELHAYRATMMALYASGSISWEQEALMTNLRIVLNISTDEHLAELRNLASSSVHVR